MYVTDSVTLTPDFTNTMPRGMLSFAKHSWRPGSVPAPWESANVDARWYLLLESGKEIDSPMECHTPKHAADEVYPTHQCQAERHSQRRSSRNRVRIFALFLHVTNIFQGSSHSATLLLGEHLCPCLLSP